jgi:hypothetical protein
MQAVFGLLLSATDIRGHIVVSVICVILKGDCLRHFDTTELSSRTKHPPSPFIFEPSSPTVLQISSRPSFSRKFFLRIAIYTSQRQSDFSSPHPYTQALFNPGDRETQFAARVLLAMGIQA